MTSRRTLIEPKISKKNQSYGMFSDYGDDLVEQVISDTPILTKEQYNSNKQISQIVKDIVTQVKQLGGDEVSEVGDTDVKETIFVELQARYLLSNNK